MVQTTIASFKSWPAICALQNALLRLLVAVTDDEEVLEGLRTGFPHLFSDTPSELVVPASVLSREARIFSEKFGNCPESVAWDEKLEWAPATEKFSIPEAFHFSGDVPPSLAQQLIGQKLQPVVRVSFEGVDCIVTSLPETKNLQIGDEIPSWYIEPEDFWLYGVPAKFIDLNS